MSDSAISHRQTPTPKTVKRSKFLGRAELGCAGPCPHCGRSPSYDQEMDEYDPDFLYPATRLSRFKIYHAVCSETWGGCGHVALGLSPQACIEIWNNPTPDVAVRFDLPKMEQMVATYEAEFQKWQIAVIETGVHHPHPEAWWFHYDPRSTK